MIRKIMGLAMITTSSQGTSALLVGLFARCSEGEIFKLQFAHCIVQWGFRYVVRIIWVIIPITVCL